MFLFRKKQVFKNLTPSDTTDGGKPTDKQSVETTETMEGSVAGETGTIRRRSSSIFKMGSKVTSKAISNLKKTVEKTATTISLSFDLTLSTTKTEFIKELCAYYQGKDKISDLFIDGKPLKIIDFDVSESANYGPFHDIR